MTKMTPLVLTAAVEVAVGRGGEQALPQVEVGQEDLMVSDVRRVLTLIELLNDALKPGKTPSLL